MPPVYGAVRDENTSGLPDPKPARATIQAAALVNHARIEVSVIAVKQSYSDLEDFPDLKRVGYFAEVTVQ